MLNCSLSQVVDQSVNSTLYTYVYSRYSCISWVYYVHISFAYAVVFTGGAALLTRVIPKAKVLHSLFGRLYLVSMFWCMGSSLLIHNYGLPFPIIISFLYLLTGISVGYLAIWIHSFRGVVTPVTASFWDRFFSLKSLHGLCMTYSWYQMLGRLVVTNPASWTGCVTYPAYKCGQLIPVAGVDPVYFADENVFLILISVPAAVLFVTICSIYICCTSRKNGLIESV